MAIDEVVERLVVRTDVVGSERANSELKKTAKSLDEVAAKGDKATSAVEKMRGGFDSAQLSFLFFGMAIERIGKTIAKSSVDAFMKISMGTTEAGRAITQFGAEWTYLKFEVGRAIGEALAPLLPILIPIFRAIADFAQKNPGLVLVTVFGAIAAGMALMTMANVTLFLQALGSKGLLGLAGQNFSGAESVLQALGKGVLFAFSAERFYESINELDEGRVFSSFSDALAGVTGILAATGKYKAAGYIAVLQIGAEVAAVSAGEETWKTALRNVGLNLSIVGGATGNMWVLAVGISFFFLPNALERLKNTIAALERGEIFSFVPGGDYLASSTLGDALSEIQSNRNYTPAPNYSSEMTVNIAGGGSFTPASVSTSKRTSGSGFVRPSKRVGGAGWAPLPGGGYKFVGT